MTLAQYLKITKETRRDFAERAGLHFTTIQKYIKGGTMPRLKELAILEQVTEGAVMPNDFLDHFKELTKVL